MNEESILVYVKKLLGIQSDYNHFDPDIIYGINAAFAVLTQLNVGPAEGFSSCSLLTLSLSSASERVLT